MHLEPLQQWICDTCGETINNVEEGYLQWLVEREGEHKKYGFHIVHHLLASPKGGQWGCYYEDTLDVHVGDLDLEHYTGVDGLSYLLTLATYRNGVRDVEEFIDIVRRIQTPYYEEARFYFDQALNDGVIEHRRHDAYSYKQTKLQDIIERYTASEEGEDEEP